MDSPALPPARSFFKRRVLDPIVAQLTQGITPKKVALTIAVGSAVAVFPVLGTSTVLCILAGITLRLNQPIIQLINQLLWPVHVPVIFLCIRVGERLFNAPHVSLSLRRMHRLFWDHPQAFFNEFGATALRAITAWLLLAPVYMVVVYFATLFIIREIARLKAEAATKESFQP